MDDLNSDLCVKILKLRGINLTPARQHLLELILERGQTPFSLRQLLDEVKERKIPVSVSSVIMNVKLFSVRGIIKADTITTHSGAGRPGAIYVLVKK